MTNNKATERNYHVRICVSDIFGCAANQNKCSYGLGYKLALQRKSDKHVSSHRSGTNAEKLASAGRVIIEEPSWYVPLYTPSITNRNLMLGHTVSKVLTELSYIKISSYMKDVTTEKFGILSLVLELALIYFFM